MKPPAAAPCPLSEWGARVPSRLLRIPLLAAAGIALLCSARPTPGAPAAARIVSVRPGYDWSLPAWVRMTPNAGYFGGGHWLEQRRTRPWFQDGAIHIAHYVHVTWAKVNPAENKYDWTAVDARIAAASRNRSDGFVLWIGAFSRFNYTRWKWARSPEKRRKILRETCMIPRWAIQKGHIHFLSNGAVAAWEPGCGYQKFFGRFLQALGNRYKNHPKLIGVDMRGLDNRYGEWCWRGGPRMVREAEENTGLTPKTFQTWGLRFIDDFTTAFKGREHRLVWPNADDDFIPGSRRFHYGPASRALYRHAFAQGCGVRSGEPSIWYRYITPGWGCSLSPQGYLLFHEDYPPYRNHAVIYSENSEYDARDNPRWGPARLNGMRFFAGSLRVLQLRADWEWLPGRIMDQIQAQLNPWGGERFIRWIEFELGKHAENSPDAWCWLREGYRAKWARFRPVKNFERWLLQRDAAPGAQTVPCRRMDISAIKFNYASGKGYEFQARRTDLASNNRFIAFRTVRNFLAGGPHAVWVAVTFSAAGPKPCTWHLEYATPAGTTRTPPIRIRPTLGWQTATLALPNLVCSAAFPGKMDFRIAADGPGDLAVTFVRIIRTQPPHPPEPAAGKSAAGPRPTSPAHHALPRK